MQAMMYAVSYTLRLIPSTTPGCVNTKITFNTAEVADIIHNAKNLPLKFELLVLGRTIKARPSIPTGGSFSGKLNCGGRPNITRYSLGNMIWTGQSMFF